MKFEETTKVLHREWSEVTIPAKDFYKLYEGWFKPDENYGSALEDFDYIITMTFEKGAMLADEMWGVYDSGKVWSSSFHRGILEWSEDAGQYVSHIHGLRKELGNFVSATFTVDEDLRKALGQL